MYPNLVRIGSYVVPPYSILLWMGIGVGLLVALRLGRRAGMGERDVLEPAALAIGVALVGARLFSVLFDGDLERYLEHPLRVFAFWRGGLVYYGGLFGGIAGAAWGARRRGVAFLDLADLYAPAVTIGLAFGRIGCFLTGCCYGAPTSFPIAVVYDDPDSPVRPLGTPLHPAPLYEAAAALAIGLWLVRRHPRRTFAGDVFSLALLAYAPVRFGLEMLRADSRGDLAGLSTSQWISLGLVALGIAIRRRASASPSPSAAVARSPGPPARTTARSRRR
jgi:phosphatidylglycerol:prolipoprotein diacylglycerol transferase